MRDKELDIIGNIKCLEVREQEDGSALLMFDVDEEFKQKYVELFKLEEWSLEHFEQTLSEAIEKKVKEHKGE
jgi:hypothetical protein